MQSVGSKRVRIRLPSQTRASLAAVGVQAPTHPVLLWVPSQNGALVLFPHRQSHTVGSVSSGAPQ